MQKKLFSSLLMMLASTFALSALADTKGTSSGPATPTSPPPMSQQQFKSSVDKAVKENVEDLNSRVQQIQKAGPGALIQPEPMHDPNAADDQNVAPQAMQPATPAAPPVIKPAAPKPMPAAPTPAPAQTQPDSAPANTGPTPYSGFGGSKPSDSNGGSNNNNSKSNSWNMGY